jgi:lysine 6-dehydrogenase
LKIHCLGGGLVGLFVTRRLVASGLDVHLFDVVERETDAIFHLGDALSMDHSGADLVINMLPGSLGNKATELLKDTGQKIVDLSFSEITPDHLESVSSSILWDVGIAPGLSNMLVSMAVREYGELDSVTIKVGGNPSVPDSEWSYMAPFSPHDVIAEYTRPARIIVDGSIAEVPAMTELHTIDANGRTMEAFLTDGLRSLLNTPAKSMGEYTVRWPGHIQKYQQSDFNPDQLVDAWKMDPTKSEFTWMEIHIISGVNQKRWIIEDNGKDGDSSMARTTGLVTACCAQEWIKRPSMLDSGVHAPESLPNDVIESIINVMRSEGVTIELK